MYFYRAEGYGCIPLLLFLSHYLRFLDIHPPDDLCITSYCDNSSLLNHEEEFYTRDIDSSSLYTKLDHDHDTPDQLSTLPCLLACPRGHHDEMSRY
jgi:hypothetical protein